MTQQELLDYAKEMLLRGERYTTIAQFLKNQKADAITTQIIFKELDKMEKEIRANIPESNRLPVSWSQLFFGILLTACGLYYFNVGLQAGRISLWITFLGISGLIMLLKEMAKVVVNFVRK